MKSRRMRTLVWTLAVLLVGRVMATAAEPDQAVMMSPFEVQAMSVEFKGWTKLKSPNFVVYTDARVKDVRPLVRQMEMQFIVMQMMFGRRPLVHEPIMVVLPTAHSDWRKIQSKGAVDWKVAVSTMDSYALACIVEYDWKLNGSNVVWESLGKLISDQLGLNNSFPINRGIGSYFGSMRMTKDGLRVGEGSRRVMAVYQNEWMDWEQVFRVTPKSDEFTRDTRDLHRFEAQAALFVHYWLTRPDPEALTKLLEWDALIRGEQGPTEERFQSVFGLTWAEWQKTAEKFLGGEEFQLKVYNFPPGLLDFVVTEVGVKAQEMRDLFVLMQIHNKQTPEGLASLDAMLAQGLKTTELRPLLIDNCIDRGRRDATRPLLEQTIADGNATRETYEWLARGEFWAHVPRTNEVDLRLPEEEVETVRRWARLALEREPDLLETNEILAWTEAMAPEVTTEQVEQIKRICRVLEGNGRTDEALAAFALASYRTGDLARSRRVCELLLGSPFSGIDPRHVAATLIARMDGQPDPVYQAADAEANRPEG